MSSSHEPASATVYQFPARGRFAPVRQGESSKPATNLMPVRAARIAFSSGWYHDEAIEQERAGD